MVQMNLYTEKKQTHGQGEQTCGFQGWGVGWTGGLELVDANYCIWSGQAMKSCCIKLGTISNHLRWSVIEDNVRKRMCIYDWLTLLYSRIWPNIVNQLQ